MKKIIILFLTVLAFASCNHEPKTITYLNEETGEIVTDTLPFGDLRDFPQIQKETRIDRLIQGMTKSNCVFESAVGIGGAYTPEYAYFERLTQLLNDNELYKLTNHEDPNVKIYAFKALERKNSKYLEKARTELSEDTSKACVFSGCIQMTWKISEIVKKN